jgi:hypothetical protein
VVALGALNLLVRSAPSSAPPAAAAIIRHAAAALAQAPGKVLHIRFTGVQDNGDGTTVSWSQESFSEQRPPYDARLINERLSGTPPGVEQGTVNGVSQLYDPTRNVIYIGPPPTNPNRHHYEFRPGPTRGTYRVRVPIAYLVRTAKTVSTVWRTVVVTAAQAKSLRNGTATIVWTRHGKGNRLTNPRVARTSPAPPENDASNLDPFSATFRGQVLSLLRSGRARVAGHATVDGRDTIEIRATDGHLTYYLAPNSYTPVELTTRGTTGGTVLRFDVYQELPLEESSKLLSLTAQHPTAIVDRDVADYQAAEARLFPHG